MPSTATLAAAAMTLFVVASSAWAASNRIWVSGHGVDQAGCGAPTAPCRSLQFAHDHVAAGGEIDVLDPAGYGAVTISKSVSIVNDGVGTAGVQATSGAAISIMAGAAVRLRGLNIDGVNGAGQYGIDYNSAGILEIENCSMRHFLSDGLLLEPSGGLPTITVVNSAISDNGDSGVAYSPPGTAATQLSIDNVIINNNASGITANTSASPGNLALSVTNALVENNNIDGIDVNSPAIALVIDLSKVVLNSGEGVHIFHSTVHVSRSDFNLNGDFGILNESLAPGTVYTTGDNRFSGNLGGTVSGSMVSEPTE